jgi:hypothetical protein
MTLEWAYVVAANYNKENFKRNIRTGADSITGSKAGRNSHIFSGVIK